MDELSRCREEINRIDEEMAHLFEERLKAGKAIAEYKKEHGLPVKDRGREEALIERNRGFIKEPVHEEYYVNFLKDMIDISCRYQERLMSGMKVAYSGVEGSFAYIASKALFPEATLVCRNDFAKAYKSVMSGECDCAVLPLENSYAGEVNTVMDLAFSGDLFVNKVLDLPVRHCLLGAEGSSRESIKTVISHPQALLQCSEYIAGHGFKSEEYGNTALAARKVKEDNDPSVAAIASRETADIMGLSVLDDNIQDSGVNTTRFAVFAREAAGSAVSSGRDEDSFILVFTVKNEAGALAQTLNIIGAHGYNMRSLRSRPMKELLWNYYFFIEAEGNINTVNGQDMMRELSAVCARLKLVGSYRTFRHES
ncbi:MAG: chorismate mutase [Lachnospiraceae bacterium]|nr:chorismate mutase [Lachnospiraceae bacterium]